MIPGFLQGFCKVRARFMQGWRGKIVVIKEAFRNEQICN